MTTKSRKMHSPTSWCTCVTSEFQGRASTGTPLGSPLTVHLRACHDHHCRRPCNSSMTSAPFQLTAILIPNYLRVFQSQEDCMARSDHSSSTFHTPGAPLTSTVNFALMKNIRYPNDANIDLRFCSSWRSQSRESTPSPHDRCSRARGSSMGRNGEPSQPLQRYTNSDLVDYRLRYQSGESRSREFKMQALKSIWDTLLLHDLE
ncbi:hypothetical protein FPV67DRAFT_1199063 [Lyophyllum atratum]|nr:hypothetical protein FPV67DRAFT_1199063 [Lyophyllum atratum]